MLLLAMAAAAHLYTAAEVEKKLDDQRQSFHQGMAICYFGGAMVEDIKASATLQRIPLPAKVAKAVAGARKSCFVPNYDHLPEE